MVRKRAGNSARRLWELKETWSGIIMTIAALRQTTKVHRVYAILRKASNIYIDTGENETRARVVERRTMARHDGCISWEVDVSFSRYRCVQNRWEIMGKGRTVQDSVNHMYTSRYRKRVTPTLLQKCNGRDVHEYICAGQEGGRKGGEVREREGGRRRDERRTRRLRKASCACEALVKRRKKGKSLVKQKRTRLRVPSCIAAMRLRREPGVRGERFLSLSLSPSLPLFGLSGWKLSALSKIVTVHAPRRGSRTRRIELRSYFSESGFKERKVESLKAARVCLKSL